MIRTYQMRFLTVLAYANSADMVETAEARKSLACAQTGKRTRMHSDEESLSSESEAADDVNSIDSVASELSDVRQLRRRTRNLQDKNSMSNTPSHVSARKVPNHSSQRRVAARKVAGSAPERSVMSAVACYKTPDMPADNVMKSDPLLDHQHVIELLADHRESNDDDSISDTVSLGSDSFCPDDTQFVWNLFKKQYRTAASAQRTLQLVSQHQSMIAFHEIDFGGDAFGINGCTPTDVMHSMKLGLLRYVSKWLMDLLKPSQKAIIDDLSYTVIARQRQTESRYYPRTNFSHSVTGVSMLTADEWVGVLFTMTILLQTTTGQSAFEASKPNLPPGNDVYTVVNMIEMLLSCMTWLSTGPFWKTGDKGRAAIAEESIDTMIENMVANTPRHEGNGWCIIKLHDLRHICQQINKFGSPMNWDSSTGERNLKEHAKNPAKTAQMRGYKTFLEQTLKRTVERQALAMAAEDWRANRWLEWDDTIDAEDHIVNRRSNRSGSRKTIVKNWDEFTKDTMSIAIFQFTLVIDKTTGSSQAVDAAPRRGKNSYSPPAPVIAAIQLELKRIVIEGNVFHEDNNESTAVLMTVEINVYTEATLRRRVDVTQMPPGTHNRRYSDVYKQGLTLRCHPNYIQDGPWNDWVTVAGQERVAADSTLRGVPAKLHCMCTWHNIETPENVSGLVVIHPAFKKKEHRF